MENPGKFEKQRDAARKELADVKAKLQAFTEQHGGEEELEDFADRVASLSEKEAQFQKTKQKLRETAAGMDAKFNQLKASQESLGHDLENRKIDLDERAAILFEKERRIQSLKENMTKSLEEREKKVESLRSQLRETFGALDVNKSIKSLRNRLQKRAVEVSASKKDASQISKKLKVEKDDHEETSRKLRNSERSIENMKHQIENTYPVAPQTERERDSLIITPRGS